MSSEEDKFRASLSRIHAAIDKAIRSRVRLQEAKVEVLAQRCAGLETAEAEQALHEASLESEMELRALSAQLLTAEG